MAFSSSSSDTDSDDEYIAGFVQRLARTRKLRVYRNRTDNFTLWDEDEFYTRFRFSKRGANLILHQIKDKLHNATSWNHAVTPSQKLLLTLRFLATNNFLVTAGDLSGIHKSTASKAIWQVVQAIAQLKTHISMPRTRNAIVATKACFYEIAHFPNVIGALDCTHVKIESPGGPQAEIFRNRKNFFSINVQVVCDADLKIMDVVARWPGSVHDARIFMNSRIKQRFEMGDFTDSYLMVDSAYAASSICVPPLSITSNRQENLFNESQIRTRNPIERTFGVLKRRFPILALGIRLDLQKVQAITVAACILHNIAIDLKESEPPSLSEEIIEQIEESNSVPVTNATSSSRLNTISNLISYFENLL